MSKIHEGRSGTTPWRRHAARKPSSHDASSSQKTYSRDGRLIARPPERRRPPPAGSREGSSKTRCEPSLSRYLWPSGAVDEPSMSHHELGAAAIRRNELRARIEPSGRRLAVAAVSGRRLAVAAVSGHRLALAAVRGHQTQSAAIRRTRRASPPDASRSNQTQSGALDELRLWML